MSNNEKKEAAKKCGIVMPISKMDGCSEEHWQEVLAIISAAVEKAGFDANLVSAANDVGVIQKRIVQNLYDNPIIVCDISGRNANVMFELGMRLAFDKPVIIVKDDQTPYSFDTSPIEHLTYPRDLRFSSIVEFKEKLCEKILAAEKSDQSQSFLKSFGQFKVAEIDVETAPADSIIIDQLETLRRDLASLRYSSTFTEQRYEGNFTSAHREINVKQEGKNKFSACIRGYTFTPELVSILENRHRVVDVLVEEISSKHFHVDFSVIVNKSRTIAPSSMWEKRFAMALDSCGQGS